MSGRVVRDGRGLGAACGCDIGVAVSVSTLAEFRPATTCFNCDYDLSSFGEKVGPGLRCPECGEIDAGRLRAPSPLLNTHVWLVAGLWGLLASCFVFVVPRRPPPGVEVFGWVMAAATAPCLVVSLWQARRWQRVLPCLGFLASVAWALVRLLA